MYLPNIRCPKCNRNVDAILIQKRDEIKNALEQGGEVRVMHLTDGDGDHIWQLNDKYRTELRAALANDPA